MVGQCVSSIELEELSWLAAIAYAMIAHRLCMPLLETLLLTRAFCGTQRL